LFAQFLAHEARAANKIKRASSITVIIGNPPYSKMSANLTQDAVSLVEPFRYIDGRPVVERGALALELNLQDDYVKFFGFMIKKMKSTPRVIGSYISNFRYLDSRSLRGMRKAIIDAVSRLTLVNLGGHVASRRDIGETDENVFDIEQGVAICFLRKTGAVQEADARYTRLLGTRQEKYSALLHSDVNDLSQSECSFVPPMYKLTGGGSSTINKEYNSWPSIEEIFPMNSGGIITSRDGLAIAFDAESLHRKMQVFARSPEGDNSVQKRIGFSVKAKWDVEACKRGLRAEGIPRDYIRPILYRLFDVRQVYYYIPLIDTPSRPICTMLEDGSNLVLLTPRVKTTPNFCHVFVSRVPAEKKVASHDRATQMFPLWTIVDGSELLQEDKIRAPNVGRQFAGRLRRLLGLEEDSRLLCPQAILHYIYAILHCPSYRKRYGRLLKDDYPRIPLTTDRDLYQALGSLGADLVALHLLEDSYAAASWTRKRKDCPLQYPISKFLEGANGTTLGSFSKRTCYQNGRVYLDTSQRATSSYFDGVPENVWNFDIGGYQVLHKWLYDRRGTRGQPGRTLTDEDIAHYQRIVVALKETIRLMSEIDEVIDAQGGWPIR
jgi:predicted helicase